jgi:spermidine synthase
LRILDTLLQTKRIEMKEGTGTVRSSHLYLYVLVSVSGGAILSVELLGTRVLGPFYGVSLFLWSALISVTLAALSVGYAIGGRWADRGGTLRGLGSIIAASGVWLLAVPWMRGPVLRMTEPIGLRIAVLAAAVLLFFPPLVLLGMVSPFAVKLRTSALSEVGRSAGNLYAVSTVASVVAAVLTGFVLIPALGVSRLLLAIGTLLLLTAVFALLNERRRDRATGAAAAVFVLLAAVSPFIRYGSHTGSDTIAFEESPYAEVRVVDYLDARFLIIDGSIHTFVDVETGGNLFPYVHVIELAKNFFEEPGRICVIGLGGGTIAGRFSRAGWRVDAVEIDPTVIDFAYEYFLLDRDDAKVFEMDGRRYLQNCREKYDIIVFDAFGGGNIPFQLVTVEAFGLAASRLETDGLLVMNIEAVGWNDIIVRSTAATLGVHLSNVLALPIAEPPNIVGNVILFASNRELELPEELPIPEWRFSSLYDKAHAWDNRFVPDTEGVPVLTDDRSPISLWAERINLATRRQLHHYFRDADLRW